MAEIYMPGSEGAQSQYKWTFNGRIMALDNGPVFALEQKFKKYMELDTFAVLAFDPAGKLENAPNHINEFQVVNNLLLGDGAVKTFYACLDNSISSHLEPLNLEDVTDSPSGVSKVLANLEMPTVRLDDLEDIKSLDIAIFDSLHDNVSILENGVNKLRDSLLIDINIPLKPTHKKQSDFCQVAYWMAQNGFEFCRFQNFKQITKLPINEPLEQMVLSEMVDARAIFLPNKVRLNKLSENQLLKLSFVLHTVYRLKDLAYYMLSLIDQERAKEYLVAEGILWPIDNEETEFTITEDYSPDIWIV